jgi:hypothetical protein
MRFWLLPLFCVGCATAAGPPVAVGFAAREDGVDIQVEMVTRTPSFAISVDNHARDAVSFAGAEITVEDESGNAFRVFTDAVKVAPGGSWRGGLAATSPRAMEQLAHGRLGLVMRGVRLGARELEPQAFVFENTSPVACATPK